MALPLLSLSLVLIQEQVCDKEGMGEYLIDMSK